MKCLNLMLGCVVQVCCTCAHMALSPAAMGLSAVVAASCMAVM